MGAEAARVLDFSDEYVYGSAIPARKHYEEPEERAVEIPSPRETVRQQEQAGAKTVTRSSPVLSAFAVLGTIFVSFLMVFAVLAQVNYNEIANEAARLNAQLKELSEQERKLEIAFESVVDMKEIETYARDVLGMSKPEAEQVAIIRSTLEDSAEIIAGSGEENALRGIGSFLSSLTEYFKR